MNIDPGVTEGTVSLSVDPHPSSYEAGGSQMRLSQLVNAEITTTEPHAQQPLSNTDTSTVQPDPLQKIPHMTKKHMRRLKKAQRNREGDSSSISIPVPPPTASVPSAKPIPNEQTSSSPPPPPSLPPTLDVILEQPEVPAAESPLVPSLKAGLITDMV